MSSPTFAVIDEFEGRMAEFAGTKYGVAVARIAVIGCGHMGSLHARKLAAFSDAQLVAVCDPDKVKSESLALECGSTPYTYHHQIPGMVDAVVIATPSSTHAEIALDFLNAGVHVLVEKPMAHSVEAADGLIQAAKRKNRLLLCGHIERFNPAFRRFLPCVSNAFTVYAERGSVLNGRHQDVGIVHDLMIHDIDLILAMMGWPQWVGSYQEGGVVTAVLGFHVKRRVTIRAQYGKKIRAWTAIHAGGVSSCDFSRTGNVDPLKEELRFFVDQVKSGFVAQDCAARNALEIGQEIVGVTA